ncbi:putative entry exclusion protein TrbK-alt [Ancylobacter lacus]|uniref:putative entry exclusion protein TrbK-alt n=1 Tax=Ancylobacter lacus TaxID=2579970 RepID=UPI001BCBB874|nr:putative entry exclusion protein TrbK-alt [Ancylobacter lacus]MBS7541390.1 putative entry exclusion protein TrbK-alt [Ancylobacter lacus]
MDGKTLARIGAVVFVAVAIVATAIEMNRKPDGPDNAPTIARPSSMRNPLDAELARCSSIGEAGGRDPSCLKAWGEARRRFLGQTAPATASPPAASAAPTTLFPSAPTSADPATPALQSEPATSPVSPEPGVR